MDLSPTRSGVAFTLLGWISLLAILPGLPGWTGSLAPYEVLGWLLALLLVAGRVESNWFRFSKTPTLVIAVLFALSLAIPTGLQQPESLRPLLMASLMVLAGFSLTSREVSRFPLYIMRVGWLVVGIALLDYAGVVPARFTHHWRTSAFRYLQFDRLSATFFHPNLLAWYLALVWMSGWWLTISRLGRGKAANDSPLAAGAILTVTSVATMMVFALTLSRAVPLGVGLLMVCLLPLPFAVRRFWTRASVEYIAFGALGFAFGLALQNDAWIARLGQLETQAHQAVVEVAAAAPTISTVADPEQLGRVAIWKSGFEVLQTSPIWGLGASGYLYKGNGHIHTHSVFLEVAVSGGLLAFVLGLALLSTVFRRASPFARFHRLEFSHFVVGLILVTGIFDCFLFFNFPLQITAFAAGILCRPAMPLASQPAEAPAAAGPSLVDRFWSRCVLANEKRAVVGLVCIFCLFATIRSEITYKQYALNQPIDFFTYYAATQYVNDTGDSPYLVWPANFYAPAQHPMGAMALERHGQPPLRYFYPPTSLIAFTPLASIRNADWALIVWRWFELACLLAIVFGIRPMCRGAGTWFSASLMTVLCVHIYASIYVGQVSLPLGAAAIWAWRLHRGGRSFSAGALVAFAASIKIFPVFWLAMFLLKPRDATRAMIGFLCTGLLLIGVTWIVYDHSFWTLYQRWVLRMLELAPPIGSNIALRGLENLYPFGDMDTFRIVVLALLAWLWLCGVALAWRGRITRELSYLGLLSLGVLALPLAWPHYICIPIGILAVQAANAIYRKDRLRIFLYVFVLLLVGTDLQVPRPALNCLGLILIVATPAILQATGNLARSRRGLLESFRSHARFRTLRLANTARPQPQP